LHVFIYLSPRSYKYPTGEARKCVYAHTQHRKQKALAGRSSHPGERACYSDLKNDWLDGEADNLVRS